MTSIISFCVFLLLFIGVGILSAIKNRHTTQDYLMASQSVPPFFVALSAISTNNSGYMFVGMIGYTYEIGLASIWLMVGWILGDFLVSLFIHKRLRLFTEATQSLSYAEVLSRWYGTNFKKFRFLSGLLIFIFLGTYAAAQLEAGSKALFVLFNWHEGIGAAIGAFIVMTYCFVGGIRASVWTDVIQAFVMLFAMGALFFIGLDHLGGWIGYGEALKNVSKSYLDIFPSHLLIKNWLGPVLFIIGWLFAGFGIIGQPHIMIRFMMMQKPEDIFRVRFYYYTWYILFYALTIGVGMLARIILPDLGNFDPEIALPMLAQQLFPGIVVGLVIAGLFAAIMSTADSQVLSCTAAVTRDLLPKQLKHYWINKIVTVIIVLFSFLIALYAHENVFNLVIIAWSVLGASFGPLLIIYVLNQRPSQMLAVLILLSGFLTTIVWIATGLNAITLEIFPGMLAGLFVAGLAKLFKRM